MSSSSPTSLKTPLLSAATEPTSPLTPAAGAEQISAQLADVVISDKPQPADQAPVSPSLAALSKPETVAVLRPISAGKNPPEPAEGHAALAQSAQQATVPLAGTDDWTIPKRVYGNRYFVALGNGVGDMHAAIVELNKRMLADGLHELISIKQAHAIGGRDVAAGEYGPMEYKGAPVLCIGPGKFWNWNPAHSWHGDKNYKFTEPHTFLGLTIAQCGQSEALVAQDPTSQIFIVKNSGFVAYAHQNAGFEILAKVDTLKLKEEVYEGGNRDGLKLGEIEEVSSGQSVVATFFNVPAKNVVILQEGDRFIELPGGQHVITNPHTTYRCFLSKSQRQYVFTTQPANTLEGVPVEFDVTLRYKIVDAIKLTANYKSALDALLTPAQVAVNDVVSRASYKHFMKTQKTAADNSQEEHKDPFERNFFDTFKEDCKTQLQGHATDCGIVILGFEVRDRRLTGPMGKQLEATAQQVLTNQVNATQVALQNEINTRTAQGKLAVAQVDNESIKQHADAEYYRQKREIDAQVYQQLESAKAKAQALGIETTAEASRIKDLADAHAQEITRVGEAEAHIPEGFAQAVQLQELQVKMRQALPANTILFGADAGSTSSHVTDGFAAATGVAMAMNKGLLNTTSPRSPSQV